MTSYITGHFEINWTRDVWRGWKVGWESRGSTKSGVKILGLWDPLTPEPLIQTISVDHFYQYYAVTPSLYVI